MCKISINNVMARIDVCHTELTSSMLERGRYIVRHSQHLCKIMSGIIPQLLFYGFQF